MPEIEMDAIQRNPIVDLVDRFTRQGNSQILIDVRRI